MTFRARVHIIVITALAALAPLAATSQSTDPKPKWEQVESSPASEHNRPAESGANVTVRDMYIYVELDQAAPVKLFTILGQPVSQMQLPAGTSRIRVSARGIYILKIGSATRRITI